jgi:Collagen triple helix repeat (20 copies)
MPTVTLIGGPANGTTVDPGNPWPRAYLRIDTVDGSFAYTVNSGGPPYTATWVDPGDPGSGSDEVEGGAPGPPGADGPPGPAGPTGPPGKGIEHQGEWDADTTYELNDVVTHDSASWISLADLNVGQEPGAVSTISWGVLSEAGPEGDPGPAGAVDVYEQPDEPDPDPVIGAIWIDTDEAPPMPDVIVGATGPPGPEGPAGPTGATGAVGPQGVAGPQGSQGATGVQGPQGVQGIQGVQGGVGPGIKMKGSVATSGNLPPTGNQQGDAYIVQSDDSLWIWDGTQWVSGGSIQGPQGPQGIQGTQGLTGATGPQGPSGQAAGKILYPALSDPSDIAGYKTLLQSPSAAAEQTIVTNTPSMGVDVLIASFVTDPGVPGAVDYPAGTGYRRIYGSVNVGVARFHLQVYKRDAAGTETLIRDEYSAPFSDSTVAAQEWTATASAAGALLATDRIVAKVYAQRYSGGGSGMNVTSYWEGTAHTSQVQTTISAGAQGPKGDTGSQGPQGNAGAPGSVWRSGTGAPAGALGIIGDWYENDANGDIYEKTGASAYTLRDNLTGPQGSAGATGSQGPKGDTGSQGIQGVQGPQGAAEGWYSGAGAPSGATGVIGDWYLDSTSGDIYEKTASAVWTLRANIKGPTGSQGPQGIQGATGNTGAQGNAGPGVPVGGTANQILKKNSATDYDTSWSTPASSGPARVTSLPASPTDGQEVYYVADATNGVLWHLRYNAGSASAYKWEFVGGRPLHTQVDAKENTTVATYGNLTTVGPDVTVPLVGDYDVSFGAAIISQGATHLSSMGLTVNAAAVVVGDEASVNNQTNTVGATAMMTRRKTAIPASALLRMQYKTNSVGVVADFSFRWLQAIPIRVG